MDFGNSLWLDCGMGITVKLLRENQCAAEHRVDHWQKRGWKATHYKDTAYFH